MLILAGFIFLSFLFVYYRLYLPLRHWKERDLPHPTPSLVIGNLGPIAMKKESYGEMLLRLCTEYEKHRYFGIFQFSRPAIVVLDRELIKQIFVKQFDHFTDHYDFVPKDVDIFWKKGLFSREGEDWHNMRITLSPAFTSSKMKLMFHLVAECMERYVSHFADKRTTITLDVMNFFRKFNNDVIASCGFGIDCDCLKNENDEFYLMGKEAFDYSGWKAIKLFGNAFSPTLSKLFKIKMYNDKITKFFMQITKETIEFRKKTGLVRPDVMHLLIEAQKGKLTYEEDDNAPSSGFAGLDDSYFKSRNISNKIQITDEDIASQALIFFFGSYDTISVLLCQVVYELVAHKDVQEKLAREVDEALSKCNGQITYEALFKMKYLDMVVSECLRLWPPGVVINRVCVKPFTIEAVQTNEKNFLVEPGTDIILPVYAFHRNPKYFENPDKFDPERFSDERKNQIQSLTYFPFGAGPRHCIGNRFALMITKLMIVGLLGRFQLVPVEKTVIPFKLQKDNLSIRSLHGYWYGLKPRVIC